MKLNVFKVFLAVILLAIFSGCSVVGGKSTFDAFMDGDEYSPAELRAIQQAQEAQEKKELEAKEKQALKEEQLLDESKGDAERQDDQPSGLYSELSTQEDITDQASDIVLDDSEVRCLASDNPSFSYRKRIAVLPMVLQQRQDAVDIPYVEREYSQELVRRLDDVGSLISIDASAYHALNTHSRASRLHSPVTSELIRYTAKDLNAQFLVTGQLLDLSFDRTKTHAIDLVTSLRGWKDLGRQTYQGATGSYWRQMNLEISVFDGPSGALLKRKRYTGEANHFISAQRTHGSGRSGAGGVGLDGQRFWQSDYGQLLSQTLDEQAKLITRSLECIPLRAQVSRVDADVIEINTGVDALLMPGDRMRIFHKEPAGRDPQGVPKHRWKYYGAVTIVGVFPLKAVAQLDEGLPPDIISVGDIVQAW